MGRHHLDVVPMAGAFGHQHGTSGTPPELTVALATGERKAPPRPEWPKERARPNRGQVAFQRGERHPSE